MTARVAFAVAALLLLASWPGAAGAAQPILPPIVAPSASPIAAHVAPLDEYFGRMKMSVLGIQNELRLLRSRAIAHPHHAESVLGMASLIEDAMHEWQRRYPADPWLATDLRRLQNLYLAVPTTDGMTRAHRILAWLLEVSPTGSDTDRAILALARELRHSSRQASSSP